MSTRRGAGNSHNGGGSNNDAQEFQLAAKIRADQTIWVDRIAKELKAQREYSAKWGMLSDPKTYMDMPGQEGSAAKKLWGDTKTTWSPWFPRNAPVDANKPRPASPSGFVPKTFKITSSPAPKDVSKQVEKMFKELHAEPQKLHLADLNHREFDTTLIAVRQKANMTPQQKYYHPATTGQEYGWVWSRPSLEIYGSASVQPIQTSVAPSSKKEGRKPAAKLIRTLH